MNVIESGQIVNSLMVCATHTKDNLSTFPKLLQRVIVENRWKCFVIDGTDKEVKYDHFEEFVTAPQPYGMGIPLDHIQQLLQDASAQIDKLVHEANRP